MKTLTFLLAVFVFCSLYLQSVESDRSGTSKSSGTSKTSERKQTEKRCIDSCQCPNGTACLPKKIGKQKKTCQTCECRLSEQCRKNQSNEVFCDCSDSGYTGMNCETPLEKSCPDGWIQFDGSCYRRYKLDVDWFTANDNCKSISSNSHLVEITSIEENEFIYNNFELYFYEQWTGLTDIRMEGEFEWYYSGKKLDDDIFETTFRARTAEDDCVTWYYGNLFDYDCSNKYPYMCEITLNGTESIKDAPKYGRLLISTCKTNVSKIREMIESDGRYRNRDIA